MDMNWKKIMCALLTCAVVCTLSACRRGGGETTAPAAAVVGPTVPAPAETRSDGIAVGEWLGEPETVPAETIGSAEQSQDETIGTTDPKEPAEAVKEPTQVPGTTEEETIPQTSQPQTGDEDGAPLGYEEYMAMTPAEQQAYYESFPSLEDYIAWYNAALAQYQEDQNVVEVTGPFDFGDFIDP